MADVYNVACIPEFGVPLPLPGPQPKPARSSSHGCGGWGPSHVTPAAAPIWAVPGRVHACGPCSNQRQLDNIGFLISSWLAIIALHAVAAVALAAAADPAVSATTPASKPDTAAAATKPAPPEATPAAKPATAAAAVKPATAAAEVRDSWCGQGGASLATADRMEICWRVHWSVPSPPGYMLNT
jgi:hypothetical protein